MRRGLLRDRGEKEADVSPVKSKSRCEKRDAWDLNMGFWRDGTDSVGDDAGFIYGPVLCTLMYLSVGCSFRCWCCW